MNKLLSVLTFSLICSSAYASGDILVAYTAILEILFFLISFTFIIFVKNTLKLKILAALILLLCLLAKVFMYDVHIPNDENFKLLINSVIYDFIVGFFIFNMLYKKQN